MTNVLDDSLAALRWDTEYRNGRYRDEAPVPFVAQIIEQVKANKIAVGGQGLYVGCGNSNGSVLLRSNGGTFIRISGQERAGSYFPRSIVAGPGGAIVFSTSGSFFGLVRATLIRENRLADVGEILSVAPVAKVMPRLARGSNTLLAAWVEDTSLYVASLDLDGRPRWAPQVIASGEVRDAAIAFDGTNFMIAWRLEHT